MELIFPRQTTPTMGGKNKHSVGSDTQGPAPSPAAAKACQATEIYRCWYIFFGLQVRHLASTPAADCPCAYLSPRCQLPLGFGGQPAVPRTFHSTILLNRNSFLNHPAGSVGQPHIAWIAFAHIRSYGSCAWHGIPNLLIGQ